MLLPALCDWCARGAHRELRRASRATINLALDAGRLDPSTVRCSWQSRKTSDTLNLKNMVIVMDVCSDNSCVGAVAAAFQSECGVQ